MKISEFGPIKSSDNVKKRSATASTSSFSDFLNVGGTDDTAPAAQLSDIAAASGLDSMLALQEISEEEARRKKLQQQGNNTLDVLERLRHRLLTGQIPAHLLHDLTHQIALQKEQVNDPVLLEIIGDIELRAAVELAKLEKAAGN